jgi:hypothetical protein
LLPFHGTVRLKRKRGCAGDISTLSGVKFPSPAPKPQPQLTKHLLLICFAKVAIADKILSTEKILAIK